MNDEGSAVRTEADRQERLAEFAAEAADDGTERFRPGSPGCHELLDRASLLMNATDEWLLGHPACFQNAEWFVLATRAFDALYALYQGVGAAHLGEGNDGGDPTGP